MLISIHDSSLKRTAYMDNVVPLAMHYADDTWRRLLKEATSTFTFKVDMLGRESEQYLTDDAYISFEYNSRQYLFNVMRITHDSGNKSIIVYCENLSLELLNETKAPIEITTSRSLLWYLNNDDLLNNAGLTLGINEVSDKVARIKLESEQTGLARLTSIANNFDAEIEFVTELNGDGTLKSMTVNFFKKYDGVSQGVGTYRRDLILEYGHNVDGIKRTVESLDLYNVITPTGKDGLDITSLEKEEYDEYGNLEYYTKKGSPNIFGELSRSRYRAQLLNDTDGWLRRYYSADGTSNVNTLYTLALNELKKHAYPAITYEVTGFYDLDIGDTVRIVDHSFTPTLIVQARVAEQSICFSDPTKNKTTFGNILALESRVSQDLTGRLKELVDQATPYRFEIVSDNGLTFKNSTGSTTLTARVYKGSNIDEVSVDSFEWLLDGVKFGGNAKSQLVNASQVTGTSVVRYNTKIGDTVIGGLEVTLQDISDGKNGGKGDTGATGDGISKIDSKWQITASSTKPSDAWSSTKWKTTLQVATTELKYLWQINRTTYTSGKTSDVITLNAVYGDTGQSGTDGKDGTDGTNGTNGTDGQDAIVVMLSNDNVTLPANALGGVLSYNGADNSISVSLGNTQLTPVGGNVTANNTFSAVHSASGIGVASSKIINTTNKSIDFSGFKNMSSEVGASAVVTYTITVRVNGINTTFTKIQNISKAEKGITGDDGIDSYVYLRYSPYITGDGMVSMPNADSKFIGVCTTTSPIAPSSASSYTWSRYTGIDGDKYGDNLIPNPRWEMIPRDEYLTADKLKLGNWGSSQPTLTKILTADNDAPSEPIIHVEKVSADNYVLGKGIPVEANQKYLVSYEIKTKDYALQANSPTMVFRVYGSSIDSESLSSTGYIQNVYPRVNGEFTTGNNAPADKTGASAITSNVWVSQSFVVQIASTGAYIRPTLYNQTANSTIWYRKISVRKVDSGAVVKSSAEPVNRVIGMIWHYTGTSTITLGGVAILPSTQYIWTGATWQTNVIRSTNLQVDNSFITNAMIANAAIDNAKIKSVDAEKVNAKTLEALSAIIGKLTNTYTVDYGAGAHTGTVTIENGMKIVDDSGDSRTITDFTSQSSGQGMFAQYLPNKSNLSKYQQAWYTPFSLRFDDTVNDWHGQITAENVTLVPWTNLTYLPGYTTAENNPCQYRKIKNLDGSYIVQFRGQVKPVSGNFAINTQYNPIRVPTDAQPATNKFGLGIGDFVSTQSVRLVSFVGDGSNKGTIQVRVTGTASAYIAIDNLTYIL